MRVATTHAPLYWPRRPGWEINPTGAPIAGEPVIDKTANSAFIGTELDQMLRGLGVDKLILCGNTLDCCVHCTLRHANDLNYQTLLLSDCCGCVEAEVGGGRTRAFLAPCLTPGPLATRRCPGCARR